MKKISFTKMHGLGNDFILIEDMENTFTDERELSRKLCHRNFSIGADGVVFIRKSEIADIEMVIYNSDGSYASMCGNAIRCFAKYVWDKKIVTKNPIKIQTGDGIKAAELTIKNNMVSKVTINMGKESFFPEHVPVIDEEPVIDKIIKLDGKEVRITSMRMGVTHTVVFCSEDEFDMELGRKLEKYKLFPEKTNVNFCCVLNEGEVRVATWERGAGATMACGTGSCASVVASNKLGVTKKKVKVNVPGGEMEVEVKDDGVFMTGPAVVSFEGKTFID
jgi:diaminopimelate epimerase